MNNLLMICRRKRDKKRQKEWVIWGVIVLWSFIGERFYFDFENKVTDWWKLYIPVKIIFMILVGVAIYCICNIAEDRKKRKKAIELIKYASVVFIPYCLLFLIIWPGIWYGDDMLVLYHASVFQVVWIQGLMITVFDMVLMMLLPIPSMVQFVHIIILSIVAGMCFRFIYSYTKNRIISCLAYLPYIFPPVVYYTFFAHRSCTCGLLAFLFIVLIINEIYFNRSNGNILFIAFLAGVLPGLRTETILLSVFGILALLVESKGGGGETEEVYIGFAAIINYRFNTDENGPKSKYV